MTQITPILIDRTNADVLIPEFMKRVSKAGLVGIDLETQDTDRHPGLNIFSGYREDGSRNPNKKLAFDYRRTTITGLSLYVDGDDVAVYFNLNHADIENRLAWEEVRPILDMLPESGRWIAHNAQYELTCLMATYGFELPNYICTMQMAVSAFGPDEYDRASFLSHGQAGIRTLIPELMRLSVGYQDGKLSNELEEVVQKILGKQSDAAHSYNGWVSDISYGYGLKKLVKRFFGYDMVTFEKVLGDKHHMGELTGAEVVSYGADDAYWAVCLFHKLLQYMSENNPDVIQTFLEQENPMVREYSKLGLGGMKVNYEAIEGRRDSERVTNAKVLRELKATVCQMLPFSDEPHQGLAKRDKWYANGWQTYRKKVTTWANSPDVDDPYLQCRQTRGALINAWSAERGDPEPEAINISHYMPQRTMLYDLTGTKLIIAQGKTQSDGEARGKLKERFEAEGNPNGVALIEGLNKLSSIDQRLKLFITPYVHLTDPETQKLYPTVSSTLATRRMGASTPNPMQLAKRGESTYVRGFFEADYEDHVVVSVDWSAIELVEIGEFSGDPEFIKAFGQIPHEDLHGGAASSVLSVVVPGLNETIFNDLKRQNSWDNFELTYGQDLDNLHRLKRDLKGNDIDIGKAFKFWRNALGKPSNFGYWYSGFLGTVGDQMGWDVETTAKASEAYRERFSVAEAWRLEVIATARRQGYIELPDHHRRVRFEATEMWKEMFLDKFLLNSGDELAFAYNAVWNHIAYKIQKRAWNQSVNAMIQGSCATIAKRSVLRIEEKKKAMGLTDREIRFMAPIHDELVYSVHKDLVPEGVKLIRGTMIDHPDMFQKCQLDASPSVGLTFEPFVMGKVPLGQVELYEAPEFDFLPKDVWGGRLDDDQMRQVVDYLFYTREKLK